MLHTAKRRFFRILTTSPHPRFRGRKGLENALAHFPIVLKKAQFWAPDVKKFAVPVRQWPANATFRPKCRTLKLDGAAGGVHLLSRSPNSNSSRLPLSWD